MQSPPSSPQRNASGSWDADVVEGWLVKKGRGTAPWKRRFFWWDTSTKILKDFADKAEKELGASGTEFAATEFFMMPVRERKRPWRIDVMHANGALLQLAAEDAEGFSASLASLVEEPNQSRLV